MKQLILHAGQHKTGSTAIQRFLSVRREDLLRLGYLAPDHDIGRGNNHKWLIDAILGNPSAPEHADAAMRFRRTLQTGPADNAVLSSEYLEDSLADLIQSGAVSEFSQRSGLSVAFVMYVRADVERINSLYVQRITGFRTTKTVEQFALRRAARARSHYSDLARIARLPGSNVTFRPYDEEVRRRGVVRDFLSTIGISEEDQAALGQEPRANEAVGPIALAAARETSKRIRQEERELTVGQQIALQKELLRLTRQGEPEPSFHGIDTALSQAIEDIVAEERERFGWAAWGAGWDAAFKAEKSGERRCNAFDPGSAEPQARERYEWMLDRLWSAAQILMGGGRLPSERPEDAVSPPISGPSRLNAWISGLRAVSNRPRSRVR
jgi:hypothetical protein